MDQAWLRSRLEELERIPRPSASEGERRAAEWLVGQFATEGVEAGALVVGQAAPDVGAFEVVFLLDELGDAVAQLRVVHGGLRCR